MGGHPWNSSAVPYEWWTVSHIQPTSTSSVFRWPVARPSTWNSLPDSLRESWLSTSESQHFQASSDNSLIANWYWRDVQNSTLEIQGDPKMAQVLLNPLITLSNINRFSKFFHCQNQGKICNNNIPKDPTTTRVCRYTTLWNVSVLKAYKHASLFLAVCDWHRLRRAGSQG